MRSSSSFLRQLIFVLIALAAFAEFSFGQYQDRALERARSVKMLTDDREAVRKIFHDFNLDRSNYVADYFSFGETEVEVTYSSGECDELEEEIWDVPKDRIVRIEISDEPSTVPRHPGVDLSKMEREQMYTGWESRVIHHSKKDGFAVVMDEGVIKSVVLFPSISKKAKTCSSKFAKEFVELKSFFGSKKLEDRHVCDATNGQSDVTELTLSRAEVEPLGAKVIDVSTLAVDPENDILTYNYTVTGGRIIGAGAKVQWDLSGVRPGTYTITAGVDDGAGVIGQTKSMTVVVK